MSTSRITIGLMSGTSLDGVDAVAVEFSAQSMREVGHAYLPFSPALRELLYSLCSPGDNKIDRAGEAATELARQYAQATLTLLEKANLPAAGIAALGAHGQTIRHRPEKGFTVQILNGALLAELTGIDVICDFRSRDIAAGGEGAPLVPAFHAKAFSGKAPRAILNIGGISNFSLIPSMVAENPTIRGGDTGPGNVLINTWCERHIGALYDKNGDWARTGHLSQPLLETLLEEPYFALPFPKSTGRELFSNSWLDEKLARFKAIPAEDVANTLTELTAVSIMQSLQREAPDIEEVYVCGGGAFNLFLMERLATHFSGTVTTTSALGIHPDHVEGAAFAWLAEQFLARAPGNLPSVTRAAGPRILGALYPH